MARTAVLTVVLLAVTAGCFGGGSGEPVRASGSPATLSAEDAGYEPVARENRTLNATVTVTLQGDVEGRESTDVAATIPVRTYRNADDQRVIGVAASPFVRVIDNPPSGGDPLGTRSPAEQAAFVQSTYADFDIEAAGERSVTLLGNETTMTTYRGTATRDGERVDVRTVIVRARHDGDVVTVVAVAPTSTDADLESRLEAVRH